MLVPHLVDAMGAMSEVWIWDFCILCFLEEVAVPLQSHLGIAGIFQRRSACQVSVFETLPSSTACVVDGPSPMANSVSSIGDLLSLGFVPVIVVVLSNLLLLTTAATTRAVRRWLAVLASREGGCWGRRMRWGSRSRSGCFLMPVVNTRLFLATMYEHRREIMDIPSRSSQSSG